LFDVLVYSVVKLPILLCISRKINFKPFDFKIKYLEVHFLK